MSKRKPGQAPARPAKAKGAAPPLPTVGLADVSAAVDRRAARQARQEQTRAAAARRQRGGRLRTAALVGLGVLIVGSLIAAALLREASKPGERIGQQASPHIADVTSPHASYSTDPPTSGPHVAQVPPWGVATTPIAKELQVHALEDGGVIVHYQPSLDKAVVDKLTTLVGNYPDKVILNPAPQGLSNPIVLTAWDRIQRFNQYDEAGLRRFIDGLRGIDHHQDSGS